MISFGSTSIQHLQIECRITNCINGESIKCIMKFMHNSFLNDIKSEYGIQLNQQINKNVISRANSEVL